jgi:hypothetical protein
MSFAVDLETKRVIGEDALGTSFLRFLKGR